MNDFVIKEGSAQKEGGFIKSIKERWFVLTPSKLEYYTEKGGELKGAVEFTEDMVVSINTTFKLQPCYQIYIPAKKRYFKVCPETEEDRDDWIKKLRTCVLIQRGSKKPYIVEHIKDFFENYIIPSEMIFQISSKNMDSIVDILAKHVKAGILNEGQVYQMVSAISAVHVRKIKYYIELCERLIKEKDIKPSERYFIKGQRLKSILILKNLLKSTIPEKFANANEEKLINVYSKDSPLYSILKDDLEKFKEYPPSVDQEIEDETELTTINCAAKYGAYKIFMLLIEEGHEVTEITYSEALKGGNNKIIEVIKTMGVKSPSDIGNIAAKHHFNEVAGEEIFMGEGGGYSWDAALEHYNFKAFFDKVFRTNDFDVMDDQNSSIIRATAATGILELVRMATEMQKNVDLRAKTEPTPLMVALKHQHIETASFLIFHGANINAKGPNQKTPLIICAENNITASVKFLVDNKCTLNVSTDKRVTPLMYAAINGNAEMARILLQAGSNPDELDDKEYTAAIYAAQKGAADVLNELMEAKANMKLMDYPTRSAPIMHAIHGHFVDCVRLLAEKGSYLNQFDKKKRNAIILAMEYGYDDIIDILLPKYKNIEEVYYAGFPLLFYAIEKKCSKVADAILDTKKFDYSIKKEGEPILYYAIKEKCRDIAYKLIMNGCPIEMPDDKGNTPLMQAALISDIDIMKVLIQFGANINAFDPKGQTILNICIHQNCLPTTCLLIQCGANINQPSMDGIFSLSLAILKKNVEMVKVLLNSGATPNIFDNAGMTPLMQSVMVNSPEITDVLMQFGADPTILNKAGLDVLKLARQVNVPRCAKIINDFVQKVTGQFDQELDDWATKAIANGDDKPELPRSSSGNFNSGQLNSGPLSRIGRRRRESTSSSSSSTSSESED